MHLNPEASIDKLTPEGMHTFLLAEMKKIEQGLRPVPKTSGVVARLHPYKEKMGKPMQYDASLVNGSAPHQIHDEDPDGWYDEYDPVYEREKAARSISSQKESESGTGAHIFDVVAATAEEFAAMNTVARMSMDSNRVHYFPLQGSNIWLNLYDSEKSDQRYRKIILNKTEQEPSKCLIIMINRTGQFALNSKGQFTLTNRQRWKRFVYYGRDAIYCGYDQRHEAKIPDYAWTPSGYYKSVRGLWPCTLKDFLEGQMVGESVVVDLIMEYFAQVNPFWNDLRADYAAGSAYSAIPGSDIWSAHSRQHLIQMKFRCGMKRNNKEPIGHGIFLARASKLVKENELQKLFGYNPGHLYLGRKKEDMLDPLTNFIYDNCPDLDKPFKLPHDREIVVGKQIIRDALKMDIQIRRKSSVTYHSARAIYEWHDHNAMTIRSRALPVVKIPKNSKFRNLKLPKDCVRLTSRKEFLEEAEFQNNCVASYIPDVNADRASVWSQRKEDGTRNTIEICYHAGDYRRAGYFYINQMLGFDNERCEDDDYEEVKEALVGQTLPKQSAEDNKSFARPHRFLANAVH